MAALAAVIDMAVDGETAAEAALIDWLTPPNLITFDLLFSTRTPF